MLGQGRGATAPAADSCDSCCCTSSLHGEPCSVGCPWWAPRLCPLLTTTSESCSHRQPVPEANALLHLGGAEQASPPAAAAEGQLAQRHQAQNLIWPGQEREAGQEAQGQSCSPWAKAQPPRRKAPDHLSSQFRQHLEAKAENKAELSRRGGTQRWGAGSRGGMQRGSGQEWHDPGSGQHTVPGSSPREERRSIWITGAGWRLGLWS